MLPARARPCFVRDTVVGAVIMSLAYLAVMSQLGDIPAREVYQTILYMSNAFSDEVADLP